MAADGRIMAGDTVCKFRYTHFARDYGDVFFHRLFDRYLLEHVGLVILVDAQAASGELFRHDRGFRHEEHRYAISNYRDEHERQHRVVVSGNLKREDDEGELRARSRA